MDDVKISPLAKRLAEENSIDWRVIHGTGPEGRVIERDILTYLAKVMSGEAELPRQPDVSEPPPPSGVAATGMMPSLDAMGFSGASATLAREGVDLSSMLSDPVFTAPSAPAPVTESLVIDQPEPDDLGDMDDAIFDLDLSDFADESAPSADSGFDLNPGVQVAPMSAHPTEIMADLEPELLVSESAPVGLPPLDINPGAPQHLDLHLESADIGTPSFDLSLDSAPVAPAMDFSLTPSEPLTVPDLSLLDEPSLPEAVTEMPDLSLPEPIVSEPVISEPIVAESIVSEHIAPEPITLEPDVQEPVMPALTTPSLTTPSTPVLETAALAAAATGLAASASHVNPAVPSAAASTTSSAVARDFFKVSALRRSFQAQALQEAARQLEPSLGHAPVAAFLVRAVGRAQYGGNVALGKLSFDQLSSAMMPPLEGSFRDLSQSLSKAFFGGSSADLTVLDASGLGVDDLVLPASGALLSLGRTVDGQATLTLSGTFNPTSGAAFLERLAGLLEHPVGLLV